MPAVDCIAHRGFAELFPENTVTAARRAAAAGADTLEVDVRRCGTGEVVVIHDETVDRVTDGAGEVADHSLSELRSLDVLNSGEGVPRLDDVLAAVPDGTAVNVELKEQRLAHDVLSVASAHGNELLLSSFDADDLREASEAGDVSLALLFADDPGRGIATARSLGCRAVHPHRCLCDGAFVNRAHEAGFAVNAWTVRSADAATWLAAAGVDGLILGEPLEFGDSRRRWV